MLVTIATATVSCCYQVPGQHNVVDTESTVVKGDLFKDYCNFTDSKCGLLFLCGCKLGCDIL